MAVQEVKIHTDFIKLQDFLKFCGAVQTGGEAKTLIQAGNVSVNKEVCLMRGKKLRSGDQVQFSGQSWLVENED